MAREKMHAAEVDIDADLIRDLVADQFPQWSELATNGRLSGVLDFGTLTVGDPACDVMVAWKLFTGESRDVFRAGLSVDDATWARSRGWALSQALAALSYHTMKTNAVLVREAEHWMAEVLGDHARRHRGRALDLELGAE